MFGYAPININVSGSDAPPVDAAHLTPDAVVESAVKTVSLAPTPTLVTVLEAVATIRSPLVVTVDLGTAALAVATPVVKNVKSSEVRTWLTVAPPECDTPEDPACALTIVKVSAATAVAKTISSLLVSGSIANVN